MTDGNQACDHFIIYRNIQSLCCAPETNSVVGQVYFKRQTNKLIEKEIRFVVTRRHGELDESSQNVQTPSFKINIRDVQPDNYN